VKVTLETGMLSLCCTGETQILRAEARIVHRQWV
jgi:hypothetical protein